MLSWRCESSCISDSKVGLKNWQQHLHEVSGRRLARITKSLRWMGSEVSTLPIFDGLSDIHIFVQEYEAQVPHLERLQSFVVLLRAHLRSGGLRIKGTSLLGRLVTDY